MNTTPLNPTQKYILQMFSYSPTEQTKQELQEVLTNFYFDKVANMGREIWNKRVKEGQGRVKGQVTDPPLHNTQSAGSSRACT